MANTIESIISEKFLAALANAGQSSSGSSALQKGKSQDAAVVTAVKTGLRTYATAVQALNTAASFVNIAKNDLTQLSSIVDNMKLLATRATKAGVGSQARKAIDAEIKKAEDDFHELASTAKFQGQNYLTKGGLEQFLATFGLDAASSKTVSAAVDQIQIPKGDDSLASEYTKGRVPLNIPEDAFTNPVNVSRSTKNYDTIFSSDRRITDRPDAYRFLNDLNALQDQITKNQSALDSVATLVADNLKLARATGLAFLSESQQITSATTASQVANDLRDQIKRNAGGALAQAENLESIAVAALLLSGGLSK